MLGRRGDGRPGPWWQEVVVQLVHSLMNQTMDMKPEAGRGCNSQHLPKLSPSGAPLY